MVWYYSHVFSGLYGANYYFMGSGEPGANIEIIIQRETMRTTVDGNGKYETGNPPFSATIEQSKDRLKSEGVRVIQTKNGIRKEKYYNATQIENMLALLPGDAP